MRGCDVTQTQRSLLNENRSNACFKAYYRPDLSHCHFTLYPLCSGNYMPDRRARGRRKRIQLGAASVCSISGIALHSIPSAIYRKTRPTISCLWSSVTNSVKLGGIFLVSSQNHLPSRLQRQLTALPHYTMHYRRTGVSGPRQMAIDSTSHPALSLHSRAPHAMSHPPNCSSAP